MRRDLLMLVFILAVCPQVVAVSLDIQLNTTEYINGLVFYSNGSYSLDNATGSLFITNPSLNDTISDINIDFSGGIVPASVHINQLGPTNLSIISYQLPAPLVNVPVSVIETITPGTLEKGLNQTVVFTAVISNSGTDNVNITQFEKTFPPELVFLNLISTAGSTSFSNNSLNWTSITIPPASSESIQVTFYTLPSAPIPIQSSNLSLVLPTFTASTALSLSAVTTTNMSVEKELVAKDRWGVGVRVQDDSEFNYSLYGADVYLSDPMLNGSVLIKNYSLAVALQPGDSWYDSFQYNYSGVPVFFARIYYTIPFNLSGSSVPVTPVTGGGFIIQSSVTKPPDTGFGGLGVRGIYTYGNNSTNTTNATSTTTGDTDWKIPIAVPPLKIKIEIILPESITYSIVPLLISIGLSIALGGGFITGTARSSTGPVVMGRKELENLTNFIDFSTMFSAANHLIINRDDLEKLLAGGMGTLMSGLVEKGLVRTADIDPGLLDSIIKQYQVGHEDAKVLAMAAAAGSSRAVVGSSNGRQAARSMGILPQSTFDFISDAYINGNISRNEFEKMIKSLIYNGKYEDIQESNILQNRRSVR